VEVTDESATGSVILSLDDLAPHSEPLLTNRALAD
jgi:hypothetical protein